MATILTVAELWQSTDPAEWDTALERYWLFVPCGNLALEQKLDRLDLNRIRELDAQGWYDFLRTEYFVWKYAGSRWLKRNLAYLERHHTDPDGLEPLDSVRRRLLGIDPTDIRGGLSAKHKIKGLGTAGASGLLSLMYPATFATVDQFVVKALIDVGGLPEAASLASMKPDDLTPSQGVVLIGIMSRKAAENNQLFGTTTWTPRKIDQVLWTYGRKRSRPQSECSLCENKRLMQYPSARVLE